MQTHDDAPEGYPALARIMGPYPSMAIFKRFATLNAHSLLMQQAEILLLERELKAMMESDRTDGLAYDKKAADLIGSVENGPDDAQWRLIVEIRQRLEDYSTYVPSYYTLKLTSPPQDRALLRHAKINKLAEPRSYDLEVLREWLKREDGGKNFLSGVERLPWLENETRDLVALSESQRAPLADWSAEKLVPWIFSKGIQKKVRFFQISTQDCAYTMTRNRSLDSMEALWSGETKPTKA